MIVPPVPTPATKASGVTPLARSCHQISGAVAVSWASQLCSLANWRGRKQPPSAASSSAIRMLPRKPPSSRVTGRIAAPRLRISSTRSRLIQSGMKIVTGWPSARPIAAKEMPVLPEVASTIRSPGARQPSA